MGKLNKKQKIAVLVSAAILGGFLQFKYMNSLSKVKSIEQYWAEVDLKSSDLESLIQDQNCYSSERYFLACVNVVESTARKFKLHLDFQGNLVSQKVSIPGKAISEKALLEPWISIYSQVNEKTTSNPANSILGTLEIDDLDSKTLAIGSGEKPQQPISFQKLWKGMMNKFSNSENESFLTGVSLNAFLSVMKDPHSYLMPQKLYEEQFLKTEIKSVALGFMLDQKDEQLTIRKVIQGSLSYEVGIRKGDHLLEINGISIKGLSLAEVSDLLKGDIGSRISLKISRDNQTKEIAFVREQRNIPTVTFQIIGGFKPAGLITINKFNRHTCEKVSEALVSAKENSVKGIVIDLRDNTGGHIEEAACVAGLFLGKDKKVFELRFIDENETKEVFFGRTEKKYEGAMAVLINSGTASAAEMLAGALQDYGRAKLIGERTFGKGSVQDGEAWSQNPSLLLFQTKALYYLPSGKTPQLVGLSPDVTLSQKDGLIGSMTEYSQYMFPIVPAEAAENSLVLFENFKKLNQFVNHANESCLDPDEGMINFDDTQVIEAKKLIQCQSSKIGANHEY